MTGVFRGRSEEDPGHPSRPVLVVTEVHPLEEEASNMVCDSDLLSMQAKANNPRGLDELVDVMMFEGGKHNRPAKKMSLLAALSRRPLSVLLRSKADDVMRDVLRRVAYLTPRAREMDVRHSASMMPSVTEGGGDSRAFIRWQSAGHMGLAGRGVACVLRVDALPAEVQGALAGSLRRGEAAAGPHGFKALSARCAKLATAGLDAWAGPLKPSMFDVVLTDNKPDMLPKLQRKRSRLYASGGAGGADEGGGAGGAERPPGQQAEDHAKLAAYIAGAAKIKTKMTPAAHQKVDEVVRNIRERAEAADGADARVGAFGGEASNLKLRQTIEWLASAHAKLRWDTHVRVEDVAAVDAIGKEDA